MTGTEATIWVYGGGKVSARFSGRPPVRLQVDGHTADLEEWTLGAPGWHTLLFSAPAKGAHLDRLIVEP